MPRSTKIVQPKEEATNVLDQNNRPIVPLRRSARIRLAAENRVLSNVVPAKSDSPPQRMPRIKKSATNNNKNTPPTESQKNKADDYVAEGAAAAGAKDGIEAIKRINKTHHHAKTKTDN